MTAPSSQPQLDRQYNPASVEPDITRRWNDADCFHATPEATTRDGKPPYSIVIPPPNVTAALHMGHALNNTLQDILTRYHRMAGHNAMWMPGTDHAGIATQTVVDKRLQAQGEKSLKDYKLDEASGKRGRESFIEKVQAWKDEYEQRITDQLKAMGCSCDWDRQRFTMDDQCAAAVREAFFQLFKDGLIYRGKRLVNWDPVSQTALADDEVEMQDVDGSFWYLRYPIVGPPLSNGQNFVTVATTRPETMLGDTAVAVNPKDPRAEELQGRAVLLPIVNRKIPIILDDYVTLPVEHGGDENDAKARMSSGFLKVTPAHDPNDYALGEKHKDYIESQDTPALINVMAPDATISKDHGWPEHEWDDSWLEHPASGGPNDAAFLLGKSREEARKLIVAYFKDHELLEKIEPHRHAVGHSYRSHVPVEPYLSDQWYVQLASRPESNRPLPPEKELARLALGAMDESQRTAGSECVWTDKHPFTSQRAATVRERATPTNPDTTHYLITFSTYGSWLHGESRGSVDQSNNLPGTPYSPENEALKSHEQQAMSGEPRALDGAMRPIVRDSVQEVCAHRGWGLLAANVRSNHVHVVVAADQAPERVMNDFKSYATRRLTEAGLHAEGSKLWARHGSTRYLNDDAAVSAATQYTLHQQGEDLGGTFDAGAGPLPHGRGSLSTGLTFTPPRYAKTFQTWHENIRDWCVSRQLWWGHRIPVWWREHIALDVTDESQVIEQWQSEGKIHIAYLGSEQTMHPPEGNKADNWNQMAICVRSDFEEIEDWLARHEFTQDPDVLDTWFSSALWPLSTLGWPQDTEELDVWNPTNVLTTAREIITLWVSRMVMFNLYFKGQLPFRDVFIHAMIQDGHGQKMSKSLGNGVDPLDIIHSHGSDAMRFTLAAMTTQTQDVRMPVDMVCPHTGEAFEPKFVQRGNYKVAAPIQESPTPGKAPGKKMVSSFGVASGEAEPTDDMPAARNTSSKFDYGRNFANKLWNAVRFALTNLDSASDVESGPSGGPHDPASLTLPDRWVLHRLEETLRGCTGAIESYDFNGYADTLYRFVWNDFCDWYIEAIKPTVKDSPAQQRVLASVIDASLRVLHPSMPFITEKLWEALNQAAGEDGRGLPGLELPHNQLLAVASWPELTADFEDEDALTTFRLIQETVSAVRNVRSSQQLSPKETLDLTATAPADQAALLRDAAPLIQGLGNVNVGDIGPQVTKPNGAATVTIGGTELYFAGAVDTAAEKDRLTKRLAEVDKSIKTMRGRLSNENYTKKAPEHLVQQTRDQLAEAEKEKATIEAQLAAM